MTTWHCFDATVEPAAMGRATYTLIRLPDVVSAAFAGQGVKRVEGEINEHPVNLALSRSSAVEGTFLWAGKSLLDRIGIRHGARVEVRLRPADNAEVEPPEDVIRALRAEGRLVAWQALTPGHRRRLLYRIDNARTEATRVKRIAAMIGDLRS